MTHAQERFPRGPLIAAACLIAISLFAVGSSRLSGIGRTEMPPAGIVDTVDLRFVDRQDGAVAVFRADDNHLVGVVNSGTGGFVRGVMRGLARERRLSGIDDTPAFRLTRRADGRLTLNDTATGRDIELDAFGPTNVQAFATLLISGSTQP